MAGLYLTHLLFATITYMILGCSHSSQRTFKLVYRPYGPKMCRELCNDTRDSFFFVLDDLSCNRIPASKGNAHDVIKCEADSEVASSAGMVNWNICYTEHNNTETPLGLNKAPTCFRNLQLAQNIRDTILHRACEEGRLAAVQYILFHGIADINCQGHQGRTPVMTAVSEGHGPVFDFLFNQHCNLSTVDDNNDNVLHVACEGGNVEIVRKLAVNMSFDIESKGNHEESPVLGTAYCGHMKLFKYLSNSDCNMKAVDKNGYNILHKSSKGGHVDIVEYILSVNISDIDSKERYGRTPVMVAALYGHRNVFDFLVSKGCNLKFVDGYYNNILHLACVGGNVNLVINIVAMNIFNIESKNKKRITPVMEAVVHGHRKVFDFLVSKECNLKLVDRYGNNILHLACVGGNMNIVNYIVSINIFNIESKNKKRATPVMRAVYNGNIKVFDFLVSNGCNLKVVDQHGNNLLQSTCSGGHVDMVKYIVAMNIFNIESKNIKGVIPVMEAVFRGHRKVFDFLVSKGCNLKMVDTDGNNILHVSCIGGHVDMVKYIFSMNIFNIESKTKNGRTPLMQAVVFGHRKAFDFLVSKGANLKVVDKKGNNILHVSCDGRHVDMAKYLLTLHALKGMEKTENKLGLTPSDLASVYRMTHRGLEH